MGERSYVAELAGLYQESDDPVDYIRMGERIDAEIAALKAENERLRGRVNDLETASIHTCHDQCQRVECVLRRRVAELESELQEAHSLLARTEARCKSQNDELRARGLHRIGVPTFDRHTLQAIRAWTQKARDCAEARDLLGKAK